MIAGGTQPIAKKQKFQARVPKLAPTGEHGELLEQMFAPRKLKSGSSVRNVCAIFPPGRKKRNFLIRGTQPIAKKQKSEELVPELSPTCENGDLLDQMSAPRGIKSQGSARDVCTAFPPQTKKRKNFVIRGTQPIAKKQKYQACVPELAPACENGELLDQMLAPRILKSTGSARDVCTVFPPGRKKEEFADQRYPALRRETEMSSTRARACPDI